MARKKQQAEGPKDYMHPHPRFKTSTDKKWLEGRLKYPTGFCSQYQPLDCQGHEGTKPVTPNGTPRRICDQYLTCPCTCHQEIDQMYELAGLPREPAEQSAEYLAMVHARSMETQVMLDSLTRSRAFGAPLSSPVAPDAHPTDERPSTGAEDGPTTPLSTGPHGTVEPMFAPTPTGRRARGQLEYDVLKVCDDYAHDVYDWEACTPKHVAEQIGKMNATEPPSTGAINAVWDRWEKLGFAKQDKKPSRFVCFEVDGSIQTLEMLKGRAKREKRRGQAEAKRGSLRPRGR